MSDESQTSTEQQEVDIDELEVKVVLIVKNASNFNQVEKFLSRRGWPTFVASKMKDALQTVVQQRPDFVVISFNHSNPKIIRLPKLLAQTFNTVTIGFSETGDQATVAKLKNSGLEHTILGGISGPSLQRNIRKILMRMYGKDEEESEESEKDQDKSNQINITGEAESSKTTQPEQEESSERANFETIQGGSYTMQSAPIKKENQNTPTYEQSNNVKADTGPEGIKQEKFEPNIDPPGRGTQSQNNPIIEQGPDNNQFNLKQESAEQASASGPNFPLDSNKKNQNQTAEQEASDAELTQQAGDKSPDHQASQQTRKGSEMQARQDGPASSQDDGIIGEQTKLGAEEKSAQTEGASSNEFNARQEGPTPPQGDDVIGEQTGFGGEEKSAQTEEPSANEFNAREERPSNAAKEARQQGQDSKEKKARQEDSENGSIQQRATAPTTPFLSASASNEENALKEVLQSALTDICESGDGELHSLNAIRKLGVIPVQSNEFSGFLVISRAGPQDKLKDSFLDKLGKSLEQHAEATGLNLEMDQPFTINAHKVNFKDWTFNDFTFAVYQEDHNEEVGVGFVPFDDYPPKINEHETMASIDIDDIHTEKIVNFKAYLHLEKNKKYFLYLRDGRYLQSKQKERLNHKNVDQIHIHKEDIDNFKQHLASAYLNNSISHFKEFNLKSA